jgi:hypothetical protein
MPGKRYFHRIAAEMGMPDPSQNGRMVVAAIYHNIVQEYRPVDAPGTAGWKKELVKNGVNVAEIPEERAKRILGKRFQEEAYYHEESED